MPTNILALRALIEENLFKRPYKNEARWINHALNQISMESNIHEFLESIISSPETLSNIAARSYRHSNGFDKIVLLSSPELRYKLRVHVWDAGMQSEDGNVHDHRWNFSSFILFGKIVQETFSKANSGDRYWHYRSSPVTQDKSYLLSCDGDAILRCVSTDTHQAGEIYSLSHTVLHRVKVSSNCTTATLVLQGKPRKDVASVYTTKPTYNNEKVIVGSFDPDDLRTRLIKLLDIIRS